MAVQAGALQLSAAAATITFVLVTGVEGLPGLGPAIFLGSASVAALVAGRAMDRFGRLPVLMCGSRPPAFSRWDLCSRLPFGRIHGRSPRASRLWFDSVAAIALALFGPGPGWIIAYVAGRAALVDLSRPIERGKLLGFGDLGAGFLAACLALVGGFLLSHFGPAALAALTAAATLIPMVFIARDTTTPRLREAAGRLRPR